VWLVSPEHHTITMDGAHRQGGDPFGLLEPHGRDGRGGLDPPKPRVDRGRVVLISLLVSGHIC